MPGSFTCPFCNKGIAKSLDTYKEHWVTRDTNGMCSKPPSPGQLCVSYYTCPNCEEISILINVDSDPSIGVVNIRPRSLARQFPEYVPEAVRNDYEEACAIVSLSPKASATLSRRCLQGMIRDFWKITDKKRLVDEIDALQNKVPATQWKILNSIRRLGNIGAHPEADVNLIIDIEPEDAQKLISVIELLIRQWYIERHEQEQLYKDVLELDQDTQSQKDKG